jgi:hypothetical protein
MNKILFLIPLVLFAGMGLAYAEPLEDVKADILKSNGSATVQLSWNSDRDAAKYEIGCVSCNPNIAKNAVGNSYTLSNITTFPNSSFAMLYLIAYDSENVLINAKQIILDLE